MTRTILTRLAAAALAAWAAYVLAWALAEAAPGPAAERAARAGGVLPPDDAGTAPVRAALIARAEARFDLGGGAAARIARAGARAARLDLGASWRDGEDVAARLGPAVAASAAIAVPALVLALLVGAGLGATAAPRGRRARAVDAVAALAVATPPAWLAILGADAGGDGRLAAALVLAAAPAAVIAVHVRAALADFLASPAALAARARGAGGGRVLAVHGLRLALPGLAPLAASTAAYLLGTVAVVERAFALPGLGRVALDAAAAGDVPVLAAVAAIAGGAVALFTGAADVAARLADPRLREAA